VTGLETIGLIAGLAGSALSAAGSIAAGNHQSAAMNAQAQAAERQAAEERAASQREAVQRAREAKLVLSRQQAVAAASGGGATDTTVLGLMGDVAAQGQFNTASALYEGEARGRGLEDQAALSRMQARQAKLAGFIGAGSTMLTGISGFASGWNNRRMPTMTPASNFRYV
jgi:hypothetical protein